MKKIFILGDIHLGYQGNSQLFQDIYTQYLEEFLLPEFKKRVKPGDILVQLGDIFHNKQLVHHKSSVAWRKSLDEFIKLFDAVYGIVGNHDLAKIADTDTTTAVLYDDPTRNIHVITSPREVEFEGKKLAFMPWNHTKDSELETIMKFSDGSVCFCHTLISGFFLNKKVKTTDSMNLGNPMGSFKKFDRVFSGHVHYRQSKRRINYVGSAYAMNRHDAGNTKGFYVYTPGSDDVEFVENVISPMFKVVKWKDLKKPTYDTTSLHGHFVDVVMGSDDMPSRVEVSDYQRVLGPKLLRLEFLFPTPENLILPQGEDPEELYGSDVTMGILTEALQAMDGVDLERAEAYFRALMGYAESGVKPKDFSLNLLTSSK